MEQEQFKNRVLPLRHQLFSYAVRMVDNNDEAEDIVQEVFLKLWYMRADLDVYSNIPALSVQITKNLCLNQIKTRKRTFHELETVAITSDTLSPDVELEQRDHVKQVMLIIDRLPNLQQTILRMKHVDEYEIEEIANLIGSTLEAVRVNLSRARKKVRDQFLKMQAE